MIVFRTVFRVCAIIIALCTLLHLLVIYIFDHVWFIVQHPSVPSISTVAEIPWYFANGTKYPTETATARWTGERLVALMSDEDPHDDRILRQLMFVPSGYRRFKAAKPLEYKRVLLHDGYLSWNRLGCQPNIAKYIGPYVFEKCPVNMCMLLENFDHMPLSDLIVFANSDSYEHFEYSDHTLFLWYNIENPYWARRSVQPHVYNWTASYRSDSDFVIKTRLWQYYDPTITEMDQTHNYASDKEMLAVALVEESVMSTSRQYHFVKELAKHISLDVVGECGRPKCTRRSCYSTPVLTYKFYLIFDNTNYTDYISDRIFDAFELQSLPVVMVPTIDNYLRIAPANSFLHIDQFETPRHLAAHLHRLAANDTMYNAYFRWRGTGEFLPSHFWCRVCAMLHDEQSRRNAFRYPDINKWWGSR